MRYLNPLQHKEKQIPKANDSRVNWREPHSLVRGDVRPLSAVWDSVSSRDISVQKKERIFLMLLAGLNSSFSVLLDLIVQKN
jgi:hypothetical protein